MARMPGVVVPSFPHPVTLRGNRRQKTFFCVDDYLFYIELLASDTSRTRIRTLLRNCVSMRAAHITIQPKPS